MKNSTQAEIKRIDNRSRLTTHYNCKPLKLLVPKTHNDVCHLVTTNYGGGYVQSDHIKMDIKSGQETKTLLTTQANARAYKSDTKSGAVVDTEVLIGKGATFIQLNDPLVLQKDSQLVLRNLYNMEEDALLLLVEWVEAGRIHFGEKFRFVSLESELKINRVGKPVVLDRFVIEPDKTNCSSPAVFHNHTSFVNIYLVGNQEKESVKTIENAAIACNKLDTTKESPTIIASTDRINEDLFIMRASACFVEDLLPIVKSVSSALKHPELLDFDPMTRKY